MAAIKVAFWSCSGMLEAKLPLKRSKAKVAIPY
jgi:hypothetical protein